MDTCWKPSTLFAISRIRVVERWRSLNTCGCCVEKTSRPTITSDKLMYRDKVSSSASSSISIRFSCWTSTTFRRWRNLCCALRFCSRRSYTAWVHQRGGSNCENLILASRCDTILLKRKKCRPTIFLCCIPIFEDVFWCPLFTELFDGHLRVL